MFWKRWWWLLIVALGLVEWGAHAYFKRRAPTEQQWDDLREVMDTLRKADELVVVAPYWAEPNLRRVIGDSHMPLRDVARADLKPYSRAIEVSIMGQDSEVADWTLVSEQNVDKFRLRVFDNPAPEPAKLDFVDHFGPNTTQVFDERRDKRTKCEWTKSGRVSNGALHGHPTFPKKRFECKGGDWHFAGVTVIEDEHYRPRRCIWAHPAQGKSKVIRFDNVELGNKIVGHGALPYFLERESNGTPVEMEVWVAENHLGTFVHRDGEGWAGFEYPTTEYAGQRLPVEFRVSSSKARQREFCFHADIR